MRMIGGWRPRLGLTVLLAAIPAAAMSAEEMIDRVVAVVGDRPILLSSLEEEMSLRRLQEASAGVAASSDSALRAETLQQLIDDRLVLEQAELKSIQVSEEEIDEALNATLSNMRKQFGSEQAFLVELAREGVTEDELRRRYRDDIGEQLRGRRLLEQEVYRNVSVSEDDLVRFYEEHQDEIPTIPRRLEIGQIVVRIKASGAAREQAVRKIEQARRRIEAGEDFETVAAEVSEGPSAARGGDLGTFRPGDMEPAFEAAMRELSPGELSEPVETRIGVHLIRLDERADDAVRAHHIIALFENDAAARDSARVRIDAALEAIEGGADFAETAAWASDDEETRSRGGRVGLFALEDLPEEYREVIEPLSPGEISRVLEGDDGFLLFKLLSVQDPRKPSFEEIKRDLREAARQEKAAIEFTLWLQKLRDEIFVRIL